MGMSESKSMDYKFYAVGFIAFILLFTISAVIRKPFASEGFSMSDATYHVLLTMQAYDETPSSVHHWLPIQSYGEEYNKYINNGPSLLQDELGNSYYVSFSPIGFYTPYFFCKFFHLSLTVRSLYIYNSFLMMLSAILLGGIVFICFKKYWLSVVSSIIYIFLPEILYTQGIVYWHHSLSQVFLLLQIMFFILCFIEHKNSKWLLLCYYVISFLYPYSEWTGFISNMGMALGILLYEMRLDKGKGLEGRISIPLKSLINIAVMAVLTVGALAYYVYRFSKVASVNNIIATMKSRAGARSKASIFTLGGGYKSSFGVILVILVVFAFFCIFWSNYRRKIVDEFSQRKIWVILIVTIIPIAENLVMREHAISYTFDRLKAAIPIIFLFSLAVHSLELVSNKVAKVITVISMCIIIFFGLFTYGSNGKIIDMDQFDDTLVLRAYLEKNYLSEGRNVLVKEGWRAWGYLQTLYHRNIYCTTLYSNGQLLETAKKNLDDYVINLVPTLEHGDTSCYTKAFITDVNTDEYYEVRAENGEIRIEKIDYLYAAELTDSNWTNGILNSDTSVILFENTAYNYKKLYGASKLICNNVVYNIINMDSDSNWIHVHIDSDASACSYPSILSVQ